MKRIFAFMVLVVLLLSVCSIVTFAEEATPETVTEEIVVEPTISEIVVDYVKGHVEEISVIVTLICTVFYQFKKNGMLDKSISTLNNNAIAVAENSNSVITNALLEVSRLSAEFNSYAGKIEEILAAFHATAEGKKQLESVISQVQGFLESAKLANVELGNEVAELLVLANIPPSKKEELYARHVAAVNALSQTEHTEVTHYDGEKA